MNLDINNTTCIAKQVNLLSTKYINICSGGETEVSHGLTTLILDGSLGLLIVSLTLIIAGVIGVILRESFS